MHLFRYIVVCFRTSLGGCRRIGAVCGGFSRVLVVHPSCSSHGPLVVVSPLSVLYRLGRTTEFGCRYLGVRTSMRSVLISSLILILSGIIAVSAIQWLVNDRNVNYSIRILALLLSLAFIGVSALFIGDLVRRDIDGSDRVRRAARPLVLRDGELEKLVYRIDPCASYKDPTYYNWLMQEMRKYSAEHPFPEGGVWVEDRDGLHQLWSQFYRPEPRDEPVDQ